MIVNGKAIASEIFREIHNRISHVSHQPHLTVFTCAPNFVTQRYLLLKKRKAQQIGLGMTVVEFPKNITTQEVIDSILHARMQTDGMVIQLPFPDHIDIDEVLQNVPLSYDVDAVHYDGTDKTLFPPVVGAIHEIAHRHDVLFASQKVVILGRGRLVGAPAEIWCKTQGAQVEVLTKESPNIAQVIGSAQILILGAGQPHLVTPDMIREGAIIFDAGTSEEGGILRGDADPACAQKASLFTPVPGGIGPITLAILFSNLVSLSSN